MNENWKPGDVAHGRINDYEGPFVYRGEYNGWDEIGEGGTEIGWDGDFIKEFRLLVVIDPEDREALRAIEADMSRRCGWALLSSEQRVDALADSLREFANPTPPKPEEPTGLGAVVEDGDGERWIRRSDDCHPLWVNARGSSFPQHWKNLTAVRVLAEGVTS